MNSFDFTVILIVVMSMLLSLFRGFVSELLSLAAWLGATVITIFALPTVSARIRDKFGVSEVVSGGVGALGTFLAAIIVLSIINKILGKFLKEGTDVGGLDKLFGLVFGFARGGFLVSLGFLMFQIVFDKNHYPEWVKQAKTLPAVEWGAERLTALAPDYMNQITQGAQDAARKAQDAASGTVGELPDSLGNTVEQGQGYTIQSRQELERLIQQQQNTR